MKSERSLVVVPQPPNTETKFLQALNARTALDTAIKDQEGKREATEFELLDAFSQEVGTSTNANIAEVAFRRNEAWRTADERLQQQSDALKHIREKIDDHIDRLRTEGSETVTSALNNKLETLRNALCEQETSAKKLKDEISYLEGELKKASGPAAKKR